MNALCGWSDANRKDLQSRRFGGASRNFVVWQGHEWYFNTKSGTWDDWYGILSCLLFSHICTFRTPEQGHFSHKVYPGCGKGKRFEITPKTLLTFIHSAQWCYEVPQGRDTFLSHVFKY
jgi:hypothetical protein